jgi:hypothetical protein
LGLTEGLGRGSGGRILGFPTGVSTIASATFVEIAFDATGLWFFFARVAAIVLQALIDRHILLSISLSALIREGCRADAWQFDPSVNIKTG